MAATEIHMTWFNPVQLEWGPNLLHTHTPEKPFFVLADPHAISLALEADLKRHWGELCLGWIWQRSAQSSITAAQQVCQQLWPLWASQPDAALLAIGGGTTLDLAKLARFELDDQDLAPSVWRANQLPAHHRRHTLWCAPTTSGTGSEVTPWATLWDLDAQSAVKRSWSCAQGFADQAWIDPNLTLTCPEGLTRDTALDTLAHALESIWNHHANALTRPLAVRSARMVLQTLPELLIKPQDQFLREQMSQASLLAGLAMSQTQTALAHALSYELTLKENLPHGHACAVWLPMVLDIAAAVSAQVQEDLEDIFDCRWNQARQQLSTWLQNLGIAPRDLRTSPAGIHQLQQALGSARGRNFVGSTA
ncbi:MAG: alcohol dehydrogenase [Comamonadaceae bacterium PBBC1]|nr:MAG: alcohol dehydrogenase [Comamonadaceae bacterium PBBC1]